MTDYIGRVAASYDPEALRILEAARKAEIRGRYWWCEDERCLKARRRRHRNAVPVRNRGGAVFCRSCGARDPRKW